MAESANRRYSVQSLAFLVAGLAIGLALSRVSERVRPRIIPSEAFAAESFEYVVEPPDVLSLTAMRADGTVLIDDEFLVGPDGNIQLAAFGKLYVAGLTTTEIADNARGVVCPIDSVEVSVARYNSKVFYVIHSIAGGDQVMRVPFTGSDFVLDALSQYPGCRPKTEKCLDFSADICNNS